jgi:MraZ protein
VGYIGQYDLNLDEKNRVNIPAKFRKALESSKESALVLSLGLENCISVYPISHWEKEIKRLNEFDTNKAVNRNFIRAIAANAFDTTMDKQGRIIIPNHLKQYASLEKELIIIGVFDKIEIWNKALYEKNMLGTIKNIDQLASDLGAK